MEEEKNIFDNIIINVTKVVRPWGDPDKWLKFFVCNIYALFKVLVCCLFKYKFDSI